MKRKYAPWWRSIFLEYKSSAKAKGRTFALTERHVLDLITQDCFYCGAPPKRTVRAATGDFSRLTSFCNGIDRLDNNLGYEPGNCVPCCITCNRMKLDLPLEKFFGRIARIYAIHFRKEEDAKAITSD